VATRSLGVQSSARRRRLAEGQPGAGSGEQKREQVGGVGDPGRGDVATVAVADREAGDDLKQRRVDERERLRSGGDGDLPAGRLGELHEILDLGGGGPRSLLVSPRSPHRTKLS
jgi:hypothetical protein